MEFHFPGRLQLGVASAAAQIEGGDVGSSWNDWYRQGRIRDGSDPAVADQHWQRWQEDTELMAKLHIRHCRLGIEWARLIPEPGKVNEEAVEHYRQELLLMKRNGIRPLLTIHHFSNPMWFEKTGGFAKRENLRYYLALVRLTAERFGDLCSDYITINEPNVYAVNGYAFGDWPPGRKSLPETFTVMENMAYCHIEAYKMLHDIRQKMGFYDTKVGFANHLRVFEPKNPLNPAQIAAARTAEWLFQGALTRAMSLGEFKAPLRNRWKIEKGVYSDFNGLNYYTRSTVSGLQDGVRPLSPRNDLGWEIYPDGLIRCAKKLLDVLDRPIWVTENGTCDNSDAFRCRYLYEHLQAISESGLPFERYYHWCFCDNFEWLEGNSARFGLVHVDYETQERTVKRSGLFYKDMIDFGGVTREMYRQYVFGQEYRIV